MKNNLAVKYTVVSLFSGCGGLDLGFKGGFKVFGGTYRKNNFEIIWANDIDENACQTYSKNLKDPIVCGDIGILLKGSYPDMFIPRMPLKADVVLGGFPCQDFSLAGKREGFEGKRGVLYRSMVEVVSRLRPAVFLAENVKGLLSMNGGKAIEAIKKDFSDLGYKVVHKLHHAADFGVPQNRERVIIVGTDISRGLPEFEYPVETHSRTKMRSKKQWLKLVEAIGDLAGKKEGEIENHFWSKAKMFKGTQGNSFIELGKIGPTMRAEHHGNIEWHWNGKRRLSAREAARIQSFPDNFIFYPSTSSAYKQIGNAVPPILGWHLAVAVDKFLNKYLKQNDLRKQTRSIGEGFSVFA